MSEVNDGFQGYVRMTMRLIEHGICEQRKGLGLS